VIAFGIGLWLGLAGEVQAHFLFVHIGPPAEGGRNAEVFFSELADAGDPTFIGKIAHTKLWLQAAPGQFQPLKVHQGMDRLRAPVPVTGDFAVVGSCTYGVLARPKQTPFLLRHFPKAMAGNPDRLNRLTSFDQVPLEIVGKVEKDQIVLTALRQGKPIPKAEFVTIDRKLVNEKLVADGSGQAAWTPPAPGRYSVYIRWLSQEAGELDGKKYEEIRDFATLAFEWPLGRSGSDPQAVALFEDAVAARAQWKDFPGFDADLAGSLDGRPFAGSVSIDARGNVQVATMEEVAQPWVQEQIESIVLHRRASDGDRPRTALRFAEAADAHPLGRLLLVEGGRFASSYRVKDQQITVVNRHLGTVYLTITVLENERNREGRFLPRSYVVQSWDAASGTLRKTETVQDRWLRLGSWDLPVHHRLTVATDAGLVVREFTLSNHLLKKD
jgi:hypothetical protein